MPGKFYLVQKEKSNWQYLFISAYMTSVLAIYVIHWHFICVLHRSRSAVKRWPLSYLWAEQKRLSQNAEILSRFLSFLPTSLMHFSWKILRLSICRFWILYYCHIWCNLEFVPVIVVTSKRASYITCTASDTPYKHNVSSCLIFRSIRGFTSNENCLYQESGVLSNYRRGF